MAIKVTDYTHWVIEMPATSKEAPAQANTLKIEKVAGDDSSVHVHFSNVNYRLVNKADLIAAVAALKEL